MDQGFSILMFIFAGAILLYAALMAITKDYNMLPYRGRVSVKPNGGYHNPRTDFRSYFITFDDGARLEHMKGFEES